MASISAQLKRAIETSGKSATALSAESGVAVPIITRFLNGERDMTLANAAKLAESLGLELRRKTRCRGKSKTTVLAKEPARRRTKGTSK